MKRMCKFIFGIFFSIFMMGIISCSGQDESTNLTIAIDMSGLLPSNESKDKLTRNVSDDNWKFTVTLYDVEEEKEVSTISVPVINNTASVTFEKIPLFFKGRLEASILEGETIKYKGGSEEFIVHEGKNKIKVTLDKVPDSEDPNEPDNPNEPENPDNPDNPDVPGDDPATGETEKTAKYTVKHYQQKLDDDTTYELFEEEEKTGIVGAETSAEAKIYEGFEAKTVEQKTIAADGSTVVQIKYNRKVVSLAFDTSGGSDVGTIEGKYGANIPSFNNPTKTGYNFVAWNPTLPQTFPAENTSYTAQWTPITYTISFDKGVEDASVNGEMNSISCTYDDPIKLPENKFTRENFDFDGWKDARGTEYKDCASVENLSSTQGAEVTLYAQWHSQSQVREVVFSVPEEDVNHGTVVTLSCATDGATIYYRVGNSGSFSEYNGENIAITSDVTITAYATKDGMVDAEQTTKTYTLKKYKVTLNYNNETENPTVAVETSGSEYTLPTEVTRTGYTFGGWELNGNIVTKVKVTNSDVSLTAQWTPITYTVVFDTNGGNSSSTNPLTQTLTYDVPQNLTENVFTREGYTFIGWNTKVDGSGTSYNDKQRVENLSSTKDAVVTLYAQWEKTNIEVLPPSFTEDPVSINKTIGYDDKITFTVEGLEGISNPSFTWYIDDEVVATESALTIDPNNTEYLAGTYSIRVIVKDENGNVYSAMYDFELIK